MMVWAEQSQCLQLAQMQPQQIEGGADQAAPELVKPVFGGGRQKNNAEAIK